MHVPNQCGLTGETTLPDFAVDPYRTPCPPPVGGQSAGRVPWEARRRASLGTEVDRNRLELHAVLTLAGVPPHPEDRQVIEHLAKLGTGATTILRWLKQTGRAAF